VFEGNEVHSVIELFGRELRPRDEDALRMLTSVGTQIGLFIERRQAERALEHRALHDLLTDLPNRGLLQPRLARAVPMARGGSSLALLLMDLDRFKEVNDTFGHHYGDFLLQEVADRLRASTDDSATVARLGGDEFAVLLPRTTESQATSVAVRIAGALRQPVVIQGHSLDIGVSIGIALCPQQADDPESLMQRADIAMYAAKRTRAGYAVYAPEHDQHNPLHLALAADLRQAIEGGLLVLHYQPKINLNTCEIGSVEALARWHHPVHGSIPPQEFIPLAEQTGLIIPLTHWVLEASIRQCRRWQDEGIRLRVAMNLSAQNLQDHDLPALVTRLLNTHGVDPHCLQLEVTESAIMIDSSRALQALQELHEAGVDISIDDFGTGYSSLTRLRRLPVRQIKIDKSFVLEMARSEDDAFIARSVIDLGHNLGLEVVAEGVSDGEIWDLLRGMGCDVAQGFYVSHPLPAGELTTWLQASAPSLEALLQARGQDRRGRRGWAGA
jgi:diguanylate cyclase (GGDEF)-like protein